MLSSNNIESFLSLVRLGIGHNGYVSSERADWGFIIDTAAKQGLSAILLDGIEKLNEEKRPPKKELLHLFGLTLQGYERRYEQYRKTIGEIAAFYNHYGFKMMVLKGYSCALNWPKPEHRPCGDIDIWLFEQYKEADALLEKVKGLVIDTSHHHHTVFFWRSFMVENHYDFINVYAHKSSHELDSILKDLGQDDSYSVEIQGEKVYLPSPNLHSLFLLCHMMSHFAAANITIRQVLDWAFFVKNHSKLIDWEWLMGLLEKYHMKEFYNCLSAICVEDLGFKVDIFPSVQFDPVLKSKVLNDILFPAFTSKEPRGLFNRLLYKYKRWQGNKWKQQLCYDESRWSIFWGSIWAKILKPSSI